MTDLELKEKLTRKMKSGDFCHQRIFHCIPLLWREYSEYMTKSKICAFEEVFFDLIKDWNSERNSDILRKYGNQKIDKAINEVISLYKVICDIYDNYTSNEGLTINKLEELLTISLKNYNDISNICFIHTENSNFSKLLVRIDNLTNKTDKFIKGVLSFDSFMKKEILPQKDFLDVFVERLKMFKKDQFCIFMLCYDIKRNSKNVA